MENRKFDDFDDFTENYRETHNKNIKITGVDTDYFSFHKIELIHDKLKIKNFKFLDFGCGDGNSESFFYNLFPDSDYFGIDISKKSIEKAIINKKENSQFIVFDGESIPFENNSFDVILAANVFHHIEFKHHEKLFSEIYRVLKPNGSFYLFEHNPYNPITRYIVKTCVFDKDARLLYPSYSKNILKKNKYLSININFILFFPRNNIFKPFIKLEKKMIGLPIGAQYFIECIK